MILFDCSSNISKKKQTLTLQQRHPINNNQSFTIQVSNVSGFRAKAKYQSGAIVKYQDVLIKDNAFRVADTKFTLKRAGVAEIKTVMTNAATGASTLETA